MHHLALWNAGAACDQQIGFTAREHDLRSPEPLLTTQSHDLPFIKGGTYQHTWLLPLGVTGHNCLQAGMGLLA